MTRILLLGGTTEASRMAMLLAKAGIDGVFSYAGRTAVPLSQPLPLRIGGFGGAEGLAGWLRDHAISHVIDATHPFAARISANAIAACAATCTPLLALERPAWQPAPGDRWVRVADLAAAAAALPARPARVFLAIGRQHLATFAGLGRHRFLLRLVDPPEAPWPIEAAEIVVARGPFTPEGDETLMRAHRITHLVAKNSGGGGAEAKLVAARSLGLPVIMIDRPVLPPRPSVADPGKVIAWLHQTAPIRAGAASGTAARGV